MTTRDAQRLAAGLDEDERAAKRATPGPWHSRNLGRHDLGSVIQKRGELPISHLPEGPALGTFSGSRGAADAALAARHGPDRGAREVAAYRQILALHAEFTARRDQRQAHPQYAVEMACEVLESVVAALAGVYQDAPAETGT